MKYTQIRLSALETYEEHEDAIESIENDYNNYHGGYKRWVSGHVTTLLSGAEKKIQDINRRIERKFPYTDEDY